jgi:hypothetical protein
MKLGRSEKRKKGKYIYTGISKWMKAAAATATATATQTREI